MKNNNNKRQIKDAILI